MTPLPGPATQSPIHAVSAGLSDVGAVREHNEDALLQRDDIGLWAVADGMGGHARGDFAAATIMTHLQEAAPALRPRDRLRELVTRVEAANAILRSVAAEEGVEAIGATLVAFLEAGTTGLFVWIGDSRGYHLRDGEMRQMTRDHSVVQELVARGEISEDEAESHPHAHVLTRAIGASEDLDFDFEQVRIARGDRVLLCSDGLTRALPPLRLAELFDAASGPQQAVEDLIGAALDARAQDNVTALAVFFE